MPGVLAARIAKLPGLHTLGVFLLVLRRRVVAVFTIATLQRNDFSHDFSLFPPGSVDRPCCFYSASRKIQGPNVFPSNQYQVVSVFSLIQNPHALFVFLESMEQNWRRLSIDSDISQCTSTFMTENHYEILVFDFHSRYAA
jgi:hypothetical protein